MNMLCILWMLDRELRLLGFARLRFGARGHFFIKKIRNLSRATCIQEYTYSQHYEDSINEVSTTTIFFLWLFMWGICLSYVD